MKNIKIILNNEKGSAIVMAMMILVIVTVIAISSSSISTVESKIVRNQRIYQQNFYFAEASTYEAAQRIEQETDTEKALIAEYTGYDWLVPAKTFDFAIPAQWNNVGQTSGNAADNCDRSAIDPIGALPGAVRYAVEGRGVVGGSSLDLNAPRRYSFGTYGLSQWNGGQVIIEIGYLKKF